MAEMKEKRASMAPHKLNDEESVKAATEKPNPNAGQTGMFSGVKLRYEKKRKKVKTNDFSFAQFWECLHDILEKF